MRRNGQSICRTVVSEMYGPATPADISLRIRFTCLHERRRTHHKPRAPVLSFNPPAFKLSLIAMCHQAFTRSAPCRRCLRLDCFCCYFRPTARRIVASITSAAWPFFFSYSATSRQINEFDRWSGGPAVPHNSIAACLARSRSGCLRTSF